MIILLFALLLICLTYNCYNAYRIWTIDYDMYHAWARYIVTGCAVGSSICFCIATWEVLNK